VRRTLRVVVGVLSVIVLLGLLGLSCLRFLDTDQRRILALTSFSAYALLGYVVLLLGFLVALVRGRRRDVRRLPSLLGAGVCLVMLAAHLVWVWPWLTPTSAKGPRLVVMSSNVEVGQGDARTVVRLAQQADVVVLQEVTPPELTNLRQAGLTARFGHQAGHAVGGVRGTMVFSRFPLSDERPLDLGNGGLTVRVAAPMPFRLYAVHTAMLLGDPQRWHHDLALLRSRLAQDAAKGPVLAAGDWNATYSHVPMRRVLDSGMRDSAEVSADWGPTWPTRWRKPWLRPVVAIDHVLQTKQFDAIDVSTSAVAHTDHRAVVAVLDYQSPGSAESQ
jgi:endonuclease/exonuclease/phosphatase family metal-dependent hydrolase